MLQNMFIFDTGDKKPYQPAGKSRAQKPQNILVYKFARNISKHGVNR